MPHQIRGAKYLQDRRSGFLFFKQRLGKCFTCIIAIKKLKEYPILIICPKIVIPTWVTEFTDEKCKPNSIQIVNYATREKNLLALKTKRPIVIANYEKVKNYDILKVRKWKIIIIDELHRLANTIAFVTRYFLRNRQPPYQRRWALTGKPNPETRINLIAEYLIIQGNFMGYKSYNKYLLEHWEANSYTGRWELLNKKHADKIDAYIKRTACLATMESIGKGAIFRFTRRMVPINNTQKKLIKEIRSIRDATRGQRFSDSGMDTAILVARAREREVATGIDYRTKEIISENKIKDVVEYWEWYREPMLVVSGARPIMEPCVELFKKAGARVAIIHGKVPFKKREQIRLDFMEGKLDAVVAQTKSIYLGLDFSKADTIMVINNLDSGGAREQIVDRIQHLNAIGIKEIIDIQSEGTNDMKILKDLGVKEQQSKATFK